MKKILLLGLTVSLFGFTTLQAQDCAGTGCFPQEVQDQCTKNFREGCVDWGNGIFYAVGLGVPNPKFKSIAQRNYSAVVAAEQVAMRNLLRLVETTQLDSETTVLDGMLSSDSIRTRISGKLRQVQVVGAPRYMSDGSVNITMKMQMGEVIEVLASDPGIAAFSVPYEIKGQQASGNSANSTSAAGVFTGLLIDARGTEISPALSPKVLNEDGDVIYGYADVDRQFSLDQGMMGYLKDPQSARSNDRIKGRPFEIKALRSSGKNNADLVISNADGIRLRQMNREQAFLREARVMVILN
ncbi:MAG: hypothetical protein HOG45_05725 [Deltaproteobacteria bacterium]|jgi:hypothetical protein|nr:hypothetical protein [Deltaproteobacteria bacterium]MBT5834648.1 hypothetical protein [Deltaproteobacteria bacterium]